MDKKNAAKPAAKDLLTKKNYDKIKSTKIKEAEEAEPCKVLENLEFDFPGMLKGLIYAEVFGKPRALRRTIR